MYNTPVKCFTKNDVYSFVLKVAKTLNISTDTIEFHPIWQDKFEDDNFWNNTEIDSFLVLSLNIDIMRNAGVDLKYNRFTRQLELNFYIFNLKPEENKIFNELPTNYACSVYSDNNSLIENWELCYTNQKKDYRVITFKTKDKEVIQTSSVVRKLNNEGGYNVSLLDKNLTFIFDINESSDLLIDKLKATYYMEVYPNLFNEVTFNKSINEILSDTKDNLMTYIKTLEMCAI